MLTILMDKKIVVLNTTTFIQYDGDATSVIIDGKRYIVSGKNVLDQIKDAIRRGETYVEVR